MKKLLFFLFIPFLTFGQTNDELAKQVFETLSQEELKTAFVQILRLDDFAIDKSNEKYPIDWEKQIDYQRTLEEYWRKDWYKKQSWWNKINQNESVAYKIRASISMLGVKNNWHKTIYRKNGKVLKPY